ncbi:hypothetical protein H6F43_04080 [Leptolyngbya sp. FACHB-36]|uniref:hypothetical protein n=1 Tax=Leptolyngbya sp. FACHB-36 TaxID=2692808 RepID=UPI0016809848|nr:hypothetical protein [Leptolyngbya sp. FACHB-36]MBD2019361.1 hypothetical protein [Leptolyngbya sp. FACHB-36]
MKFKLGTVLYVWDESKLALVKASKKTSSPGQLSLFEEQEHPRDNSGKFAPKGGGEPSHSEAEQEKAPSKGGELKIPSGTEQGIAKVFLQKCKDAEHIKLSKEEAEYEGLDHKHPGAHWEEKGVFDSLLDAYRNGGDRAVGEAFVKNLDFADGDEQVGRILAKLSFDSANWDVLSRYATSRLKGEQMSVEDADPATQILAEYIDSNIDSGVEGEGSGDKGWEKESQRYREQAMESFSSAESIQQWANKEKPWKIANDETGTGVTLAELSLKNLDTDEIGKIIAGQFKLPDALSREKQTGTKGAFVVPPEQSNSRRDADAWFYFEKLVDWDAVADHALGKQNSDKSAQSKPTQMAMQAISSSLAQDDGELAEKLKNYKPSRIVNIELRDKIKALPEIRDFMERGEGKAMKENLDQNPLFQERIKKVIQNSLKSGDSELNDLVWELKIDWRDPNWKQQTAKRLTQNFNVSPDQIKQLGLS